MYRNDKVLIGKSNDKELSILLEKSNRHGFIFGASGSGKTVTSKVMAESFSDAGIPVFLADVKGDLAGTALQGEASEALDSRLQKLGINDFEYKSFPTTFFDVYGKNGHPIRTSVKDLGPRLLSVMLGLSDAQEGVLSIVFQVAEDEGKHLDNLDDLRELLRHISDNKDEYIKNYGNITTSTIATIQRELLELEQEGGNEFLNLPELDLHDLMQYDSNGCGFVNVLDAQELFKQPTLYAVFLVWILYTLFYEMPEVGDLEKPKMVLFLDEAHLIFSEMSSHIIKKITQVVKLIRSKGVGVYFISQAPSDMPDEILAQLSNKVQHVLRAYTPSDEKAIRAACNSFRTNPKFKTEEAIKELGVGEALISFLNEKGEPNVVERAFILPPQSYMGTITDSEREMQIKGSRFYGKYEEVEERESASEIVKKERVEKEERLEREKQEEIERKEAEKAEKERIKAEEKAEKERLKAEEKKKKEQGKYVKKVTNSVTNKVTKTVMKTTGLGNTLNEHFDKKNAEALKRLDEKLQNNVQNQLQ